MSAPAPSIFTPAAKAMAEKLAQDGVPVMFLEGGLLGWESEGLPIERG